MKKKKRVVTCAFFYKKDKTFKVLYFGTNQKKNNIPVVFFLFQKNFFKSFLLFWLYPKRYFPIVVILWGFYGNTFCLSLHPLSIIGVGRLKNLLDFFKKDYPKIFFLLSIIELNNLLDFFKKTTLKSFSFIDIKYISRTFLFLSFLFFNLHIRIRFTLIFFKFLKLLIKKK